AGSYLALLLAKEGYSVHVYEKRPDMRRTQIGRGRSINLAISTRGINALNRIDGANAILSEVIPMYGRFLHQRDGSGMFQAYAPARNLYISSIARGTLNKT